MAGLTTPRLAMKPARTYECGHFCLLGPRRLGKEVFSHSRRKITVTSSLRPISAGLQLKGDTREHAAAAAVPEPPTVPTVSEIALTPEFFGACFEDDYRLEASAWPADLATATDYRKLESFVSSAHSLVRRWLPSYVISRLERFIHDPEMAPALVLRGLPIDGALPPMGPDGPAGKAGQFMSEMWLVGISRIVGQVFTYDALRVGRRPGMGLLVRDIYPTLDGEDEVSVYGSRKPLDYHVDFFHVRPESFPHVSAYIGLRGGPTNAGPTLVCGFRELYANLDPSDIRILREHKITWRATPPFSEYVIEGPESGPRFNLLLEDEAGNPGFEPMVNGRPEAVAAYRRVKELARIVGGGPDAHVWLGAGDLMLVNQSRAAHGRSAYKANCDGNDRWLQHVFINEGAIWAPTGLVPWPVRSLPIVARH